MSGISGFVIDVPEDSIAVSMIKRIWMDRWGGGGSTKPNKGGKNFPAEDAQIKINASSHVQIYHVTLGNE